MTNGGYLSQTTRNGARMGDTQLIDMMVGALTDPFATTHMGITAENVAEKWDLSRAMQDEFAVQSHQRAAAAIADGRFKDQIVPVELKSRKGTTIFDTDEHVRGDATVEGMGKLRTVFKKDGSVTAGNASGINDGAAAVVLAEAGYAEKQGLSPMARLRSYAFAGVDPAYMGEGPIPAVKKALDRAGLQVEVARAQDAGADAGRDAAAAGHRHAGDRARAAEHAAAMDRYRRLQAAVHGQQAVVDAVWRSLAAGGDDHRADNRRRSSDPAGAPAAPSRPRPPSATTNRS